MTIAFPCEQCGHRFEVDANLAGKKCKCKKCGHVFLIPVPRQPSTPQAKPIKPVGVVPAAVKPTRPARPKPAEPDPYYDADDPYGFDDVPSPSRNPAPAGYDDEFEAPIPRAKPAGSKSGKKKNWSKDFDYWYETLPGLAFKVSWGAVAALIALSLVGPSDGPLVIGGIWILFGALFFTATIGMVTTAFREGIGYGLAYTFCGPLNPINLLAINNPGASVVIGLYPLYYLVTRWGTMKRWFGLSVWSVFILIGAMSVSPAFMRNASAWVRQRQGNAAPFPIGQPRAGGPGLESLLVEACETQEQLAAILQGVQTEQQARLQAGQVGVKVNRLGMLEQQLKQRDVFNDLGLLASVTLNANYKGRMDASKATCVKETDRIKATPGLSAVFAHVLASPATVFAGGDMTGSVAATPPTPAAPPVAVVRPPQNLEGQAPSAPAVPFRGRVRHRGAGGPDNGFAFNPPGVNSPAPASETRPAEGDFVEQVLHDLKSPTLNHRKGALQKLSKAPPDETRRVEVAKAVESMLRDPDSWGRTEAAKALAVWGGKENTPALVQALKDPDFGVVWAVLDTMKAIHDPDAADAVAARMVEHRDRGKAVEALKAMGSPAEGAVVPYLNHNDVFIRMEAAKVLQEIGSADTTRFALMDLLRKTNGQGLDAMAARDAMQRLGMPKTAPPKRKSIVPGAGRR